MSINSLRRSGESVIFIKDCARDCNIPKIPKAFKGFTSIST